MERRFFGIGAAAYFGFFVFGCSSSEPATEEMLSLTADECAAMNGTTMPWDTCGSGREQLGVIEGDAGGACCETIPALTIDECESEGGTPHGDPGDGSSYRNGCPGAQKMIGTLDFGIEGGICCK
jgi:hypothetical protein